MISPKSVRNQTAALLLWSFLSRNLSADFKNDDLSGHVDISMPLTCDWCSLQLQNRSLVTFFIFLFAISWLKTSFLSEMFSWSGQHSIWAGAAGSPHPDALPYPAPAAPVRSGNTGAGKPVSVSSIFFLCFLFWKCQTQRRMSNVCLLLQELRWLRRPHPRQLPPHSVNCFQLTDWSRKWTW